MGEVVYDLPLRAEGCATVSASYPATTLQTCIVHLIRNSLDYATWKDRKQLAAAIKPIYTAILYAERFTKPIA